MSTIFTHAAIPLVLGLGIGPRIVTPRLIVAGGLFAIIPDIDVIGFELGVSYYSQYGHRGFTHSIVFAIVCGLVVACSQRWTGARPLITFSFLDFSMISHGILDALTYGGVGVGFAWPVSTSRHIFPWRPLPVSPIGVNNFLLIGECMF